MLQSLPLEIQDLVLQQTHVGALASLACTCSHYLRLAQPILYRHIDVDDNAAVERENYYEALRDCDLTLSPKSKYFDDPTTYQLFRTTLMNSPSQFGPFIVSLEIVVLAGEAKWTDFPELFSTMPNLRSLTIDSYCGGLDDRHLCALSSVTPKLRIFSSRTIPLRTTFAHFLLSHPNLTVWHHAFNDHWWDPDAVVPPAVLARLTHFETKINRPAESAKLLRGMTNINHLSITHDDQAFHTLEAMVKELRGHRMLRQRASHSVLGYFQLATTLRRKGHTRVVDTQHPSAHAYSSSSPYRGLVPSRITSPFTRTSIMRTLIYANFAVLRYSTDRKRSQCDHT